MTKEYKPLTLRIPADLHRAARMKSVASGQSLNKVVAQKLAEWLNEPKMKRAEKVA